MGWHLHTCTLIVCTLILVNGWVASKDSIMTIVSQLDTSITLRDKVFVEMFQGSLHRWLPGIVHSYDDMLLVLDDKILMTPLKFEEQDNPSNQNTDLYLPTGHFPIEYHFNWANTDPRTNCPKLQISILWVQIVESPFYRGTSPLCGGDVITDIQEKWSGCTIFEVSFTRESITHMTKKVALCFWVGPRYLKLLFINAYINHYPSYI